MSDDLIKAAQSGNRKKILIALRDALAKTIQECDSGRDMASNSKRLIEVVNELEEIKEKEKAERERRRLEKQNKVSKHDKLKRKK